MATPRRYLLLPNKHCIKQEQFNKQETYEDKNFQPHYH